MPGVFCYARRGSGRHRRSPGCPGSWPSLAGKPRGCRPSAPARSGDSHAPGSQPARRGSGRHRRSPGCPGSWPSLAGSLRSKYEFDVFGEEPDTCPPTNCKRRLQPLPCVALHGWQKARAVAFTGCSPSLDANTSDRAGARPLTHGSGATFCQAHSAP
jgi:hypothetical protein